MSPAWAGSPALAVNARLSYLRPHEAGVFVNLISAQRAKRQDGGRRPGRTAAGCLRPREGAAAGVGSAAGSRSRGGGAAAADRAAVLVAGPRLRQRAAGDGPRQPGSGPGAGRRTGALQREAPRSEEHTSELQSLMRNSYAVFCLK